ncbi:hypothetical protein FRC06_010281 [Ceratobasidium sp. 370]|nr:hypothetical protein FRC06_010281 [Ceratobasidium sp. 370]
MDESSNYSYDSEGCAEPAYSCPCCSQKLSQCQINWHLDELVDQIVSSSLDAEMSDNEGSNAGDLSMATDDPGPGSVEDLNVGDNVGRDQGTYPPPSTYLLTKSQFIPQSQEQVPINILNYVDPVILPLLTQMYQLLWNPPIMINNWVDPDRDEVSEADDKASEADDEGSIIHNEAPAYVEQEAPPGLDPDDEANLANNKLHILFDENMEDVEDHEWIELYSRVLSQKDQKTLELFITRLNPEDIAKWIVD